MVAGVAWRWLGGQGYAAPVGQLRALQPEFGPVDQASASAFTTGGRLGDAAVGAQAVEFEAAAPPGPTPGPEKFLGATCNPGAFHTSSRVRGRGGEGVPERGAVGARLADPVDHRVTL